MGSCIVIIRPILREPLPSLTADAYGKLVECHLHYLRPLSNIWVASKTTAQTHGAEWEKSRRLDILSEWRYVGGYEGGGSNGKDGRESPLFFRDQRRIRFNSGFGKHQSRLSIEMKSIRPSVIQSCPTCQLMLLDSKLQSLSSNGRTHEVLCGASNSPNPTT